MWLKPLRFVRLLHRSSSLPIDLFSRRLCHRFQACLSHSGLKLARPDGSNPISKCQIPGLEYVVFVNGSGPHRIEYDFSLENPPKEVLVSRKCAEAVLRGAQVYVLGVLACTAHVEKGDAVDVCVAVEQPGEEGDWSLNMTRGTTLQCLPTCKNKNCSFCLAHFIEL